MRETDYALGYAEAELRRLTTQARLIDPITRRFLTAAGIGPGMRVLDIGSGAGDVALLCAELVGPAGQVVGTDLALASLQHARDRAAAAGAGQVSFRHGDPAEMRFETAFDAVVGRYVLQFLPDPAQFLRRITRHLRPGGIVMFHELDWDGARSAPPAPTYDQVCTWLSRTIAAAGAQVRLGAHLGALFQSAGLPAPQQRMEAVIGCGPAAIEVIHLVTDLVATQMPAMDRLGIAAPRQVDHPTLASRILTEIGSTGTLIGRSEMGAWAMTPD